MIRYRPDMPWILHHYRMSDRQAWLLGWSYIDMECAVCSDCKRVWSFFWMPIAWAKPRVTRIREAFESAHQHEDRSTHPILWNKPLANPSGYQQWKRSHTA